MPRLIDLARTTFFRSGMMRTLAEIGYRLLGKAPGPFPHHLFFYPEENAIGPAQREEALLLFGLVRVLRPKIIVEFGFGHGLTSFNLLQAMPPGATLYSYEIDPHCCAIAKDLLAQFPNFKLLAKSQASFSPDDIGSRKIDFVWFDASHDFATNCETFRRLVPQLHAHAIVAVHDTGAWPKSHFRPIHHSIASAEPSSWLDQEQFAHQPGERQFVNWLRTEFASFAQVHLHSADCLRHGITILQRSSALPEVASLERASADPSRSV